MRAFGDGFDLYAATGDMTAGYWDSGTAACMNIVSGRFAGSRAIMNTNTLGVFFSKASGSNDAIHHIVVAFNQVSALGAANQTIWCQIQDGASVQCTITFRGDGVILLQSGGVGGATLATYSSAFVSNVWTAFEFEVVINNTAGSFTVRTNGSTTNSFQATGLNTRAGSANNYANRIVVGNNTQNVNTQQVIDDLLWRSDPTSVSWVGDIRCYTRMPASDVQKQWTPSSGTTNFSRVNEAQQDGTTTYVFDGNVGDNDLYAIAATATTPQSTVCVTTRGFVEKSDAGARSAAVQLKSGATTVQSTSTALTTSFGWLWRTDMNDPNTSAAWTATAVNNVQVGPICTA